MTCLSSINRFLRPTTVMCSCARASASHPRVPAAARCRLCGCGRVRERDATRACAVLLLASRVDLAVRADSPRQPVLSFVLLQESIFSRLPPTGRPALHPSLNALCAWHNHTIDRPSARHTCTYRCVCTSDGVLAAHARFTCRGMSFVMLWSDVVGQTLS
jgi:hypothetical protein